MKELTWVEISRGALENNIRQLRGLVGNDVILCPCVKANAYGHGLIESARVFLNAGADWLSVNALYEASNLREAGVDAPLYLLGYAPLDALEEVLDLDVRTVVYNKETVDKMSEVACCGRKFKIHIKVETGNNRQGVALDELVDFAKYANEAAGVEIEGISTHFANIEDTTDHSFAMRQLGRFDEAYEILKAAGIDVPMRHCANSAATILFPKTHLDMVRVGISAYGMWPSRETFISFKEDGNAGFNLDPAFTWKTRIAQIKSVPSGEYIGYGCTYKTTRDMRLAILPVGYYDGYDRCIKGAHVLIRGQRAAIVGRVCMNIIMVDVSDISNVSLEDEVVLVGRDGDEMISAEQFADWVGTINYEVTCRVNERIPRILV